MEPLVPHITLLHPNILQTVSPIYLIPLVKQIAETELPIHIELTGTAMFDKRVLHIAVNSPRMINLQAKLVDLLPPDIKARYEIGRKYTPHVTLLQAKPLQALDPSIIKQFENELKAQLPHAFEANKLTIFTWQGPRRYKVEDI